MQFDFAISGWASQRIEVTGRFLKYVEGKGKIRVTTSHGQYVDLMPGQGVEGVQFSGLTITDKSGAGNSGVLLAGDFAFRDDTVTGTLQTMDGTNLSTFAGNCYMGSLEAGPNAYQALINPAASGVNVYVRPVQLRQGNYSSTIDIVLAPIVANLVPNTGSYYFRNKRGGKPVSKAGKAGGSQAGSTVPNYLVAQGVPQADADPVLSIWPPLNVFVPLSLTEPLCVPPGWALYFGCSGAAGVNTQTWIQFEFREEPA